MKIGEISKSENCSNVTGGYQVGGICGHADGNVAIDSCINRGDIRGVSYPSYDSSLGYVGGISRYISECW